MSKRKNKDWATLYPDSCFRGYKKGSKEYLKAKADCYEIERDFNASFNPKVSIPAEVRLKLLSYGIIDQTDVTIDRKLPKYVEDDICKDGEERILNPVGRFVRDMVRKKGDIRLVDLLSKREKKIIRDFRTPYGYRATEEELPELHRKIGELYLDLEKGKLAPKGEAALWYYLHTRKPEELGDMYVKNPDGYRKKIKYFGDNSRRVISDYYYYVPRTKYWWMVWDALDYCWGFALPSPKLLEEATLLEELNLDPFKYSFLISDVFELPKEYAELRYQLIVEAGNKSIEVLPGVDWSMADLLYHMESAFFNAIVDRDHQIREKTTSGYTFWIAFHLKRKHPRVYDYYLDRTRKTLNKLRRLGSENEFEEQEYLDLKARLDGDLLFACVFHYHLRGGHRYLALPRGRGRPKEDKIQAALDDAKPLIKRFAEFGIKRYKYKGVLVLNALAGKEVYSTEPDKPRGYDRGARRGLKTKGEKLLDKELGRLGKKSS